MNMLGPYEIRGELGRGAMAVVWRGFDPRLEREVALKEPVIPHGLDDATKADMAARFVREAKAAARLNHPGVVTIYGADVYDGRPVIAMEVVDGATLSDLLASRRFDKATAVNIVDQLLDAVGYAHRSGIVHRDIKPDNVFVTRDGRVKLADFGIAHVGGSSTLTQAGAIMGTPGYMAPEQVTGGLVDARTDLFAVGVIAYEMLTGRNPFGATEGAAPTTVMFRVVHEPVPPLSNVDVADLDAATAAVIVTALQKDPVLRFATADDMRAALRGDLSSIPVQSAGYTPPVGAMPSPSMAAGEKAPGGLDMRVVWGGGAAVLVVAVALFMIFGTSTGGTVIITPPPPPATSTPPPPDTTQPNPSQTITGTDVSTEAQAVLDEYLAATRAQDIDRLMALYTDSVDPYRTHRRFPATKIRDERAAAFAKWPSTVMTAKGQPQITTSGESATVLYEKDWDFTNGSAYFRGAIMSRLKMRRIGGVMKIVGEEDIGAALWKASR